MSWFSGCKFVFFLKYILIFNQQNISKKIRMMISSFTSNVLEDHAIFSVCIIYNICCKKYHMSRQKRKFHYYFFKRYLKINFLFHQESFNIIFNRRNKMIWHLYKYLSIFYTKILHNMIFFSHIILNFFQKLLIPCIIYLF